MEISPESKNILTAIKNVQDETAPIVKGAKNPFYKSSYATIEMVWESIRDSVDKNGLVVTQTISSKALFTRITHLESGEWISSCTELLSPENDMQKYGIAITYARRYSVVTMFNLMMEDDDGNGAKPSKPKPPAKQPEQKPELNNGVAVLTKIAASTDPTKLENAYKTIKSHEDSYTKSGFEAITKAFNKKMAELLEVK